MLRAHWYQEPEPLPPVPEMPDEVAELGRRCLAKAPEDRPSAEAAAHTLAGIAGLPLASPLSALFRPPASTDPGATATTSELAVPPPGADSGESRPAPTRPGPTRPVTPRIDFRRPGVRRTAIATAAAVLVAAPAVAWWASRPEAHTAAAAAAPKATATAPPIRCTVRYAVQDVSDGRTSTAVTLVNDGTAAVGRWRLAFRLPTGQRLLRGTHATWHQSGADVRADGTALAPGHPLKTTFEASYEEAMTFPGTFTLNGVTCRSDLSLRGRTTPPTTVVAPAPPPGPAVVADKPGPGPANGGDNANPDKGKGKGKGKGKSGGQGKDD